MTRHFAILLLGSLFVVGPTGCAHVLTTPKKGRPMSEQELVGSWSGFTGDGLYFVLHFQAGGMGLLASTSYRGPVHLLRIRQWQYEDHKIKISVSPIDENREKIEKIIGGVGSNYMELTVIGSGWTRSLPVSRDEDRERRSELVKRRFAEFLEKNPAK